MNRVSKLILLLATSKLAMANDMENCFKLASAKYQIPSRLLKAIAKTETKLDATAIHVNANHTYDIGIMQINSSWFNKLNKVGIAKAELFDSCKNIQIGSWILAQNIKRYGFNNQAIGAYNSANPMLQQKYIQLVMRNL